MILASYVRRSAFLAMMAGVVGLWALQLVFAYLSELENLSETYHLLDALYYVLYRSPYFFVQFTPTGVLLGAVVGLGLLAANSELVVMRAAGISLYRIIGWAMVPALFFVLLSLSVNQWLLPIGNDYAHAHGKPKNDIVSINGYWSLSTQKGGNEQKIAYISYADNQGNLGDTKEFILDKGELISSLAAKSGTYDNAQSGYTWTLSDVNAVTINNGQATTSHDDSHRLSLPISPQTVYLLTKEPDDLSLTDLYAHKKLMDNQGTRSRRHELAFWQKLFSPFSVLSLVLIACSFVFGSLRSQSLGFRVVMALLTGLLFSYVTDLSGFIALAAGISPFVMALLPILLSGAVGVYLLSKK